MNLANVLKNRNKKLMVAIVAVIIIVISLVFIGKIFADSTAHAYTKSLTEWKTNGKQKLLASVLLTVNKQAFSPENAKSQKDLDEQKKACNKFQAVSNSLKQGQYNPPYLAISLFGGLSKQYKDAKKVASTVDLATSDFVQTATQDYDRFYKDCKLSYDTSEDYYKNVMPLAKQIQSMLLKNGESSHGSDCNRKGGCLPTRAVELKKYIATYRKAYVDNPNHVVKTFITPERFAGTSLEKSRTAYLDAYHQFNTITTRLMDALSKVKTFAHRSDGVMYDKARAQYAKDYDAELKKFATQMKKLYPEIATRIDDKSFESDRLTTYLQEVSLKELAVKAEAVKKL